MLLVTNTILTAKWPSFKKTDGYESDDVQKQATRY